MPKGRPPKDDPATRPDWSQRITLARELQSWNQEKFAVEVCLSQQTVGGYETGRSEPNLARFIKLAKVLKVPVEWLAFGVGNPDENGPVTQETLEGHKHDHLFTFAFVRCARLFEEVGIQADIAYLGAFTRKLLDAAKGTQSDTDAQKAIGAALDIQRAEIAAQMDILRKKLL